MANKPQIEYQDFREITKSNFEAVMKQYDRLIHKWLHESSIPYPEFEDRIRQFWEQVWVDREKFDRKKGRLSTWLGWRWRAFKTNRARAKRFGLDEAPLTLRDHQKTMGKQPRTVSSGLAPQQVLNDEDEVLCERPALGAAPYESLDNEIALRQLVKKLSGKDQQLIEWLELGYTQEEIAQLLGIKYTTAHERINAMRKRVQTLLNEKDVKVPRGPRYAFTSNVFWHEFFKTLRDTTPFEDNKYDHAAEIRTRNKWLQRSGR